MWSRCGGTWAVAQGAERVPPAQGVCREQGEQPGKCLMGTCRLFLIVSAVDDIYTLTANKQMVSVSVVLSHPSVS